MIDRLLQKADELLEQALVEAKERKERRALIAVARELIEEAREEAKRERKEAKRVTAEDKQSTPIGGKPEGQGVRGRVARAFRRDPGTEREESKALGGGQLGEYDAGPQGIPRGTQAPDKDPA